MDTESATCVKPEEVADHENLPLQERKKYGVPSTGHGIRKEREQLVTTELIDLPAIKPSFRVLQLELQLASLASVPTSSRVDRFSSSSAGPAAD